MKQNKRVVERGGDFARERNPRLTRRIFIQYGSGAFGLLEIRTVAVTDDRAIKRQITWTRNARLELNPEPPIDDRGSRMTLIDTWDEALEAIDGALST